MDKQSLRIFAPDHCVSNSNVFKKNQTYQAAILFAWKIEAQKCPRCWNYVDKLVKVDEETEVCERCAHVLGK